MLDITRERRGVFGQPADGAWKWKIVVRRLAVPGKVKSARRAKEFRLMSETFRIYSSRLIRKEKSMQEVAVGGWGVAVED